MQPAARPRVKICCISSVDEAALAVSCGAAALGLVSEMPSGPGVISEEEIAQIARTIPPGVASFLLTSRQDAEAIIEQQRRCSVDTLQLCDQLLTGSLSQIRRACPGVRLVQVVHVTGAEAILQALALEGEVDAILLDSGNPELAVKELGGTGRTHNWEISSEIRQRLRVPIFLAGGLRPENVAAAWRKVRSYGLDLCSGVRTNGVLDGDKLRLFFEGVQGAVRGLSTAG